MGIHRHDREIRINNLLFLKLIDPNKLLAVDHFASMSIRLYLILSFFFLTVAGVLAQEITVTGKVISNEDRQGMPGINIVVKGTGTGTVTDTGGLYRVNAVSADAVLVFSFIGAFFQCRLGQQTQMRMASAVVMPNGIGNV